MMCKSHTMGTFATVLLVLALGAVLSGHASAEEAAAIGKHHRNLMGALNPCKGQLDGAVFPDQQDDIVADCSTYIICKNGADTFQTCAKGTQFNPHTLQCEASPTAMCKKGMRSPKPVLCRSPACDLQLGAKTTVGSRRLKGALNPCKNQPQGAVFPNQNADLITDCSTYVVCNNGADTIKTCSSCPTGDPRCEGAKRMAFNPHTLKCDWPRAARCKVGMCTTKPLACK